MMFFHSQLYNGTLIATLEASELRSTAWLKYHSLTPQRIKVILRSGNFFDMTLTVSNFN